MALRHTGTGTMVSASGSTSQRPSVGNKAGDVRYNTDYRRYEFYNVSLGVWVVIPTTVDGLTYQTAAPSAEYIKTITGTSTNGFYWIYISGEPTQVWCDMQNDNGGWMLVTKTTTNNSKWSYTDFSWTDSTIFNEGEDAISYAGHIKTKVYTSVAFSRVRLAAGTLSNGIVENNWSDSISFSNFMTYSVNSSLPKSTWVNWMTNALGTDPGMQPFCNQIGTNKTYGYQNIKIGGTFNQENDCDSNDSSLGWGSYGATLNGSRPWVNDISFGAFNAGASYTSTGWIFVK
jgi:hypothetical protein